MRCKACNTILNDYELMRKDSEDRHVDLCSTCYRYSQNYVTEDTIVNVDSVLRYKDTDNYEDIL